MRIHRDYSRPFFSQRRRGSGLTFVLMVGLLIGGFVVFVSLRFNQLQLAALDIIGMAPTPTPMPNQRALHGLEMYAQGDVTGALVVFETTVQERPDDVNYLYEYGQLLIENDRFDEAIPVAERMIRLAPNDPRGYFVKARALMWTDSALAIQTSIQGLDADPNFAPLYAVQGVAYTNLGRWNEGIRNGRRAEELDPNDPFVQRSLYYPLSYVGLWQDAINALEQAIVLNPNLIGPYFELAALYMVPQVNQPEMAVAIYNRVIEMQPENAKAYLRLCETFARVENARFDIAQPYCDQAIEIDPAYASAYRQRGQMQYNRRNYEGSIESFNQCIAYGSEEIECYYLRGLAHFWLGQCDVAWDILNESRVRGLEEGIAESVMNQIDIGLGNIIDLCPGYNAVNTPTPIPPTAIPATPIGGFG
ncbi:MAG: hypothetical protein OHK0046_35630 [Anaerolineae bacterium]